MPMADTNTHRLRPTRLTCSTVRCECVVVTPEATILDQPAEFVALPLYDGEIGIGRGIAP